MNNYLEFNNYYCEYFLEYLIFCYSFFLYQYWYIYFYFFPKIRNLTTLKLTDANLNNNFILDLVLELNNCTRKDTIENCNPFISNNFFNINFSIGIIILFTFLNLNSKLNFLTRKIPFIGLKLLTLGMINKVLVFTCENNISECQLINLFIN